MAHLVYIEVEHRQKRVWIALPAVAFYGCADQRLGKDEVGEIVQGEILGVGTEELGEEPLGSKVVYVGIWVKEFKVDIDETLLACKKMSGC